MATLSLYREEIGLLSRNEVVNARRDVFKTINGEAFFAIRRWPFGGYSLIGCITDYFWRMRAIAQIQRKVCALVEIAKDREKEAGVRTRAIPTRGSH